MGLHDIGEVEKAAFPKLLFYVRRWVEGVKSGGIARYEQTETQFFWGPRVLMILRNWALILSMALVV